MKPIRIGIAGTGKIAREQHIPAIRVNPAYELVGCSHCASPVEGVTIYPTIEAMLEACPEIDAVAICSPPQAHFGAARQALARGKHVLLEKPPCPTLLQLDQLEELARKAGATLFQSWHARHAAAVDPAEAWLKERVIRGGTIAWKEDVRRWHPGQTWIWQAGGFGVFDAGINALSILTKIVPESVFVKSADLHFPSNCDTPIAARALLATAGGAEIAAEFDFRPAGETVWDIDIDTDRGLVSLSDYGNRLIVDGKRATGEAFNLEYAELYRRFAELVGERRSEVDRRPFELVIDIFTLGRRFTVEPFENPGQKA